MNMPSPYPRAYRHRAKDTRREDEDVYDEER